MEPSNTLVCGVFVCKEKICKLIRCKVFGAVEYLVRWRSEVEERVLWTIKKSGSFVGSVLLYGE